MAIIKHISDGTNTYDLPSGEAFKIPLSASLSSIAAGGAFSISGVKTADLKAAIAAGRPIVFYYSGPGTDSGEILIVNLGDTGGGGLGLSYGTIVLNDTGTLKIMQCYFSGGAVNVTSVNLTDKTPQSGGAEYLNDLYDVSIPSPQNGDVLTYDSNNGLWVAQPGGGGGGSQLPVVIDVGRIIHQNGAPTQTIADVPQGNITIPFGRQVIFTYRAYEQGMQYNRYWTITPCAYKIAQVDQYFNVIANADDLHWIVDDLNTQGMLPLHSDIRYVLCMYTVVNNTTYKIEIDLWLSVNTTTSQIEFYFDSTGFGVTQVQYPGADT